MKRKKAKGFGKPRSPKKAATPDIATVQVPRDEADCETWPNPNTARAILEWADEHGLPRGASVVLCRPEARPKVDRAIADLREWEVS